MSCAAKSLAGKTADMEKWIRVRRVKLFLARFSRKVTWLPALWLASINGRAG